MNEIPCARCHGSGTTYYDGMPESCFDCGGDGFVEDDDESISSYDEDDEFCLYGDSCCMGYTQHTADECYTAADVEVDKAEAGL